MIGQTFSVTARPMQVPVKMENIFLHAEMRNSGDGDRN